jgi:hypothetical protein
MKDYSRKNYIDHRYIDWMRTITAKSVWNSILSDTTGHGEFSRNRNSKTSLGAAIVAWLKQSQLKKPYLNQGFVSMENNWEGPPGGPPIDPERILRPDIPSVIPGPLVGGPVRSVFDLNGEDEYCAGSKTSFTFHGTHPIYFLQASEGTMIVLGGYGTNTVTGTIEVDGEFKGSINFNASMTTSFGVVGDSNDLMSGNPDCGCEDEDPLLEADPENTPETFAGGTATIYCLNGSPPYQWSIANGVCDGTGLSFYHNNLPAGQTQTTMIPQVIVGPTETFPEIARGSFIIRCVDSCDTVVDQQIRSTYQGLWEYSHDGCALTGDAEVNAGGWVYKTEGCTRQRVQTVATDIGNGVCREGENPCGATEYENPPECLTWDCDFYTDGAGTQCEGEIYICHFSQNLCTEYQVRNKVYYWVPDP